MPDLNGFELTKIIRKRYSLFQIPVIIISSTSFEDEKNRAFEAGANDIITKPYNSVELISRINTYITLKYSIQDNQKHLMLENELSIARKLQLRMLPHKKPFLKDIKIVTLYLPMTYLAGDFYDYYEDSNGIGVLIADVTGHGIPSAMVTAMLKAAFRILQKNISDPSLIMKGLNEILYGNDNQLLTAVYIYIDIKNKILLSSNAGHPFILLLKKSGELIEIKSKGRLIGFSLSENWELCSTKIEYGDRIILYTDGITEMKNYNGEQFGKERLKQMIKDYSYLNNSDMIESTKRTLLDFSFQVNQEDDLTLVVIDIAS
ncbi:MAG: fused response regulator/phosphatase [Spirochaetia bacterium]|nr:fused response regulator/phosphatase [Spirochaetia bacterium]